MGFPERILYLVDTHANGNAQKFAEAAGIKPTTFYNYLHGRSPSAEAVVKICEQYGVNAHWLLTGGGPTYVGYETPAPVVPYPLVGGSPPAQAQPEVCLSHRAADAYPFVGELVSLCNEAAEGGWSEPLLLQALQHSLDLAKIRTTGRLAKKNTG